MLKCGGHKHVFTYIYGSYEGNKYFSISTVDGKRNNGFMLRQEIKIKPSNAEDR